MVDDVSKTQTTERQNGSGHQSPRAVTCACWMSIIHTYSTVIGAIAAHSDSVAGR